MNRPAKTKTFKVLNDTTPFLVFLQQESEHRYKLIEQLAIALYEKGYVEKEYAVHAVLRENVGDKHRSGHRDSPRERQID